MTIQNTFLGNSFTPALRKLAQLDVPVWLCGGCLRDLWLKRPIKDVDILVQDNALPLAGALADLLRGRLVVLNQDILPTARIVLSRSEQVDISQWRAPGLLADLRARDFTVNALALPLPVALQKAELAASDFIDPTGGLTDIDGRVLRVAAEQSLHHDALRIMRAFRFMAELGFSLAADMNSLINAALPALPAIARPRLGQEWLRLMQGGQAARAARHMDKSGVLSLLLPGWEAGRGMQQNPYHHLPVLEHSLASLQAMEEVLNCPSAFLGDLADIIPRLEVPVPLLKTACLLHDLGKPATMRPRAPGWNTFHFHDQAGLRLAAQACANLGLGARQSEVVAGLVGQHMLPHFLLGSASQYPDKRRRLVGRFVLRHNKVLHSLMLMALADDMAGLGVARPPDLESRLIELWRDLLAVQQSPQLPPPLVNGYELMAGFNLLSGPRLGALHKHLRKLQLEGVIVSKPQALRAARAWLDKD